jgi:hypothetical protein
MAEIKKLGHNQNNYGWGTTWSANSRVPIIDKRRFETLAEAQSFVDDISATATATEGLIISVINDTGNTKNNGVYYVQKVANTDEKYGPLSDKGILVKVGGTETETANNYSAAVELSKTLVVGQLIKVLSAQTITVEGKELTYQAGFYIVEGVGVISALATSTGSDDEVGALKTRVDNLETTKVDKAEGERLMTDAEGTKLSGIEAGAQVNYVKNVGSNLSVDVDGILTVDLSSKVDKTDYTEKTTELSNAVASKTDYSAHTNHVADTLVHIQDGERAKWDEVVNKANKSDLETLSGSVSTIQSVVDTKADTTAVTNSINTLSGVVESNKSTLEASISAETSAREEAISGIQEQITAITSDYLKAADKTELNNAITAETSARTEAFNTLSGIIETISGDVATKASETALTSHTNNNNIHVTDVDKEKWNNAAEKVDTILTGTGVNDVIDTFIDFNNWLTEHGNEVSAMQTAITANLKSITSLTETVNDNYTTLDEKISGETTARVNAISGLTDIVNNKAAQSDLNTLSGHVGNNTTNIATLSGSVAANTSAITKNADDISALTNVVGTKAAQSDLTALANIVGNKDNKSGIFAELNALAGNVYTKTEADAKFLTGVTFDETLNNSSTNAVQNKVLYEEFESVRSSISSITTSLTETLKDYAEIENINTLNGIELYNETGSTNISVSGNSGVTVVTDATTNIISVSANISTKANNALSVDTDGSLYVQSIIIEGDDIEIAQN